MATKEAVRETERNRHPREKHAKPEFPPQAQALPGSEDAMQPRPDHGESSYRGYNRLTGKVALITGGDSGIGKAVAIAFAREGADVAISYLEQEEQDAQDTRKWIENTRRKALTLSGDIQHERHCRSLVDQVTQKLGGLDILVNNAAFQMTHQRLDEFSSEEVEYTFRVNILSMFHLCRAAVPHMKPGSCIINTASIQAFEPSSNLLAYATTKGAIVTFTKALAKLVIQQGIRVNAVAPGPVWTPLIPASMPQKKIQKFGGNTPLERPAQPAELAPLYVFLASNADSSYVTGEVFGATGGRMPT